jgi:hypothetical protein
LIETVLSVFRMANYMAELARAQRKPTGAADPEDFGTGGAPEIPPAPGSKRGESGF